MRHTRKQLSKIMDETLLFFLAIGSTDLSFHVSKTSEGHLITAESNYDPAYAHRLDKLDELLNAPTDEGMAEYYWELAGEENRGAHDDELYLLGQLVESARVEYTDSRVILFLSVRF